MSTSNQKIYTPLLDVENVLPILNEISMFGGLDERELQTLFGKLQKVRYSRGEMVFRQGDPAHYLYIVKQGRVKLYVEQEQTALEFLEFGIGKCFGETSLIGIQPHSGNVVALEDTELMVLSGTGLHELYKTDLLLFCKIIMNIARETCRRLVKTDDILLHYVLKEKHKGTIN
jgi:CRP/FNR family transcriptional regulator, cyclic AMP receptor protein